MKDVNERLKETIKYAQAKPSDALYHLKFSKDWVARFPSLKYVDTPQGPFIEQLSPDGDASKIVGPIANYLRSVLDQVDKNILENNHPSPEQMVSFVRDLIKKLKNLASTEPAQESMVNEALYIALAPYWNFEQNTTVAELTSQPFSRALQEMYDYIQNGKRPDMASQHARGGLQRLTDPSKDTDDKQFTLLSEVLKNPQRFN